MARSVVQRVFSMSLWGLLLALFIPLISLGTLPAFAARPLHYTDLTFPPLSEVQLPDYTRYQLKNGLVVYLMEDHELPLVEGNILVHTGSRLEPANLVGLAGLTGDVMRDGGTQDHPPAELNRLLEDRAASVESSIGTTSGRVSFSSLTADFSTVFRLFAEVIQTPAFAPDQLAVAKTGMKGAISRRNDDPGDVTNREFFKLLYGEDSPYARTVEYATLNRIERQNLQHFHRQYFRPDNVLLGIVGDFDPQAIIPLIEETFGSWQPDPSSPGLPTKDDLPAISPDTGGGIFFINQPQLTQSFIRVGHLGGQLDSPDYPALDVMNNVMSGFGGRLFNQLRSREGLAYSVYAYWSARYDYPGIYIAGGETRSEATVPFLRSLKAEIEQLQRKRITPQELTLAKDSTLNSFVFNFQSPSQILSRLLGYEYYGYPKDFLTRYRQGVEATTIVDIERVARQYLKPDRFITLVVGNSEAITPPLASLGSNTAVTQLDITIPN